MKERATSSGEAPSPVLLLSWKKKRPAVSKIAKPRRRLADRMVLFAVRAPFLEADHTPSADEVVCCCHVQRLHSPTAVMPGDDDEVKTASSCLRDRTAGR